MVARRIDIYLQTAALIVLSAGALGAQSAGDRQTAAGGDPVRAPVRVDRDRAAAAGGQPNAPAATPQIQIGDIGCGATVGIRFAGAAANCADYSLRGDGTSTFLNRASGGHLLFRENNATQMFLESGGQLGIGTTSPTRHVHIVGASDQELGLQSSDTGGRLWTLQSGRGALNGRLDIIDRTSNFTRMTILDTGNVGIGTTNPFEKLDIIDNNGRMQIGGVGCGSGNVGILFGSSAGDCTNYSLLGDGTRTLLNAPTGGTIRVRIGNSTVGTFDDNGGILNSGRWVMESADAAVVVSNKVDVQGTFAIENLPNIGDNFLCYSSVTNNIGGCGSSRALKTNIAPWEAGLATIDKLRPVTFNWKEGGALDVGLIAEEVEAVDPLLVTRDREGHLGLKYEKIGVVLINAVKEQEALIAAQKAEIDALRDEIALLKRAVCAEGQPAAVCRP